MFGTFRRHQTWLWAIIIAVTVVSFVIFFSPDARWSGFDRAPAVDFGSIRGRPITRDEFFDAYKEIRLSYFFRSNGREWPGNDDKTARALERETVSRLFLLEKLKDLDIEASPAAVGRMTRDRIGDYPYDKFETEILREQLLTRIDFERFIRNECAILQLVNAAAVPARLVNPRDAEEYFRKENEEVSLQLAVFWASNYLDQVQVTPAGMSNYFNMRAAEYRIPRRISVRYVQFPLTNYYQTVDESLATRTNLEALLTEEYYKRGTNFFAGPDGKAVSETEAKQRIRSELRNYEALRHARREASVFGNDLISQPDPNRLENFERLASNHHHRVYATPPFDAMGGLENSDFPEEFRTKALALTTNAPIAFSPIVGSNAVYVIARQAEFASEMPGFDQVKDKVAEDFKRQQALEAARAAGRAFQTNVTNGLALKKSFLELAAAAKVKTVIVPPLSPASAETMTNLPVQLNPRMLNNIASDLKVGAVSPFLPQPEGGFIAYLSARMPPSDQKVKEQLPEFMARLRAYRQAEVFNQWFRREAEQAKLIPPKREEKPDQPPETTPP